MENGASLLSRIRRIQWWLIAPPESESDLTTKIHRFNSCSFSSCTAVLCLHRPPSVPWFFFRKYFCFKNIPIKMIIKTHQRNIENTLMFPASIFSLREERDFSLVLWRFSFHFSAFSARFLSLPCFSIPFPFVCGVFFLNRINLNFVSIKIVPLVFFKKFPRTYTGQVIGCVRSHFGSSCFFGTNATLET